MGHYKSGGRISILPPDIGRRRRDALDFYLLDGL
jgi:hypothetical protein